MHIDIFALVRFFLYPSLLLSLSMIVWTHAVLGVLYMHVFCIFVFALAQRN